MEKTHQEAAEEIKRLRRCLNDLVSVTALPAIWTGGEASDIYRTLLATLLRMLSLDFVYIRLEDMQEGEYEFIRIAESPEKLGDPLEICELFKPWIGASPRKLPRFVKNPDGDGNFSIVPLPLGLQGEFGLMVAGSKRPEFPEQSEKLVLDIAVNQAVIALQEARFLRQQKQIANELDERVAQRTRELAAANEALKTEAEERHRAEESLRDSERMSRMILEAIPGMVALLTPTGEVEVVNRQLLEYFGQTLEELKHWGSNGTIYPEDLEHVIENFSRAIGSGEPYEIVQRFRRFDGVYRWFQNSGFPLRDASEKIVRWCVLLTDIDERKRAEDALRKSEHDWRLIVESIPGLIAVFTPDGEVEFVNRQNAEYFGKTLEELKRWGSGETTHPEDRPRVLQLFRQAIATGNPFDFELRVRRFDGIYRWVRTRGTPLRDAEGRIVRWYNLVLDINEQKRAEDALQHSERFLKLIIDTMPALAWSARPDGSAEFFSQRYLDYVGISAEEAVGWGWIATVHPEDVERLAAVWQTSMATGAPGEAEARMRRYDGEFRWFLFRANPLRDEFGNIVNWYGTNTDIEDLKRTQEALRRSEAFLVEGQHLARMGNFFWCVATEELIWSEPLYRIFEFEPGGGITLEMMATRVHPEDIALMTDMVDRATRGVSDFEYEHRLLMPDGSIKHIHFVAHGTLNGRGQMEYIGAVQDVTQRRFSEEAHGQARSELARVTRIMSLGVLTASITHEVNQPLSGIITNASTCLRMLDAVPPNIDGARETARRTIRDSNRASDVIKRLRTLFSKKDFTLEPVDLNEAAQEVIALSRNELQRNRVVLKTELAEDLPPVAGDRVQLQQVILNLLLNGIDAMSGIDDRPRKLTIMTGADGSDRARLSVRDEGTGFAPGTAEKLFDAFYTTKTGGMGIGLSVSRSIIEKHLGNLWAEPNEGPGAVFCFSIPVLAGSGDERAGDSSAALPLTTM